MNAASRTLGSAAALCVLLAACGDESNAVDDRVTDAGLDTSTDAISDAPLESSNEVGTDATDGPVVLPPVEPGVYPLFGIDAILPTDDLAPFGELFGNASVVALGESMHTSGGFYQAKARLIRYLVEVKGYRVVAFETPRTLAETTGAYVATCEGTARSALEGIFSVWRSETTETLLEWLCEWNETHASDPVQFVGFDVQQPWYDGPAAKQYLADVGGAEGVALGAALDICDGATAGSSDGYVSSGGGSAIETADYEACMAAIADAEAYLEQREPELLAAGGARELAFGRLSLLGLRSFEEGRYLPTSVRAMEARDEAMAEVFLVLREQEFPGKKAVVWAHNIHIQYASEEAQGFQGLRSMGGYLRSALGSDYAALGLSAYTTEVNWPWIDLCGPLQEPKDGSIEQLLLGLNHDVLFVDLAFPGATTPFLEPGVEYEFGVSFGWTKIVPAEQFRGLLFLKRSPRMMATDWPDCLLPGP